MKIATRKGLWRLHEEEKDLTGGDIMNVLEWTAKWRGGAVCPGGERSLCNCICRRGVSILSMEFYWGVCVAVDTMGGNLYFS